MPVKHFTYDKAPEKNELKKDTFWGKVKAFFHPTGVEVEMLRYRANSFSQGMVILALCCVVAAFSTIYGFYYKPGSTSGFSNITIYIFVDIIVSILMMLFSFYAAVEVKAYSKVWSIGCFVLAGICVGRIFTYPLFRLQEGTLDAGRFSIILILYFIAAGLYVLGGLMGFFKGKALRDYLATHKSIEGEMIHK